MRPHASQGQACDLIALKTVQGQGFHLKRDAIKQFFKKNLKDDFKWLGNYSENIFFVIC